jgi:hypothetical protein
MEKQLLKSVSVFTSPFPLCPTGKLQILGVSDSQKIDTEIFAHLEYLSEIQENGVKRLSDIKKKKGSVKNWKTFRSFIRQAKLFYFSAKAQDSSISSLNYFYSFENLVKAYCCLYFPDDVGNKIGHGLSTGSVFSDTFNQEITLQKKGIMPLFYTLVTGQKVTKERTITNKKLVPYCTDISYENQLANSGFSRKSLLMKATAGGESVDKLSLLVAVTMSTPLMEKYPEIKKVFSDNFNLVDLSQKSADEILKIPLNDYKAYTFFQGKEDFKAVPIEIISSDFYNKFSPFISFYPRKSQERFNINIPTEDTNNDQLIMNECLAIFILMFYMSELVRYHPKTIQDNLSKPTGWLMERFAINTPQTFLRYMTNLVRAEDFIFD